MSRPCVFFFVTLAKAGIQLHPLLNPPPLAGEGWVGAGPKTSVGDDE
jgi:hypothetical protein